LLEEMVLLQYLLLALLCFAKDVEPTLAFEVAAEHWHSLEETLFLETLKYPLPHVMEEHRNVKIKLPYSPITQGRRHFNVSRNRVFF
jgi:hypothetical protein